VFGVFSGYTTQRNDVIIVIVGVIYPLKNPSDACLRNLDNGLKMTHIRSL